MSELANVLLDKRAEAYEARENAKREYEEASIRLREAEAEVLDAMLDQGIAAMSGQHTTAYIAERKSWKIPRDPKDYDAFYDWVGANFGIDTVKSIFTPNSAKMNAFLKEVQQDSEEGELKDIPGLAEPSKSTQIRFRKRA